MRADLDIPQTDSPVLLSHGETASPNLPANNLPNDAAGCKICRAMRPFCGALHRATSRGKSHHALFPFPEDAQMAMRGWRAMLYLISFDEPRYTRRMESFLPEYVVEFDAGILLYKSQADGT
jgi:hypothetical protein